MNAFALLEGDDAENLLARLSTAPIAKAVNGNHLSSSSLNQVKSSDSKKKRNGAIVNNGGDQRQHNVYVQNRKPSNGMKRSSNYRRKQVEEDEDGWQTVGGRSKGYKNKINNGNETEIKFFKQLSGVDQNGAQGNASDSKEGPGDESCPKQDKEIQISDSPEVEARKLEKEKELEARKLERELEAKKMTLKQYEKLLREKRKVLESMKTEERRVALDTDFNSMHIISKKNEEEPNFIQISSGDKKTKTKTTCSSSTCSSSSSLKAKKILLCQPPTRRGGRFLRRDNGNGVHLDSGNKPDTYVVIPPPPSFEDAEEFPDLA
ncbi:RGG repeats nuclear RNA binding protein A-like [Salvia divinorum]|uniref:RGG repeats nuclear RNA binding protein A-like n=1 Tax=Salvia divinorum TaxID=28513 RepID=A0ABD1GNR8_SALDI